MALAPTVNVFATTNQYLAPYWVDIVLRSNYFFGKLMGKTEKWDGSQMQFSLKYQKGVPSVAFNGFDPLPITQIPSAVLMTFWPSFIATNVALAGTDLSVNMASDNNLKVLELIKTQMESRTQDASDDVGNYLQSDGTENGGKAPNGLSNTIDNGSVASTYGGLTRATYSGLNSTITASGGTISLVQLRSLWNNIADSPVEPDFTGGDYNTWMWIEQLQTPFQRNNADFRPDERQVSQASGYSELRWDGMLISRDKKFPAGTLYMMNLRFLKWYALKFWEGMSISPKAKDVKGNVYEDTEFSPKGAFSWTGLIHAYNGLSVNGYMVLGGQMICTAPFRQGALTGIAGV